MSDTKAWIGNNATTFSDLTKDRVLLSWEEALRFADDSYFDFWTSKLPSGKRMIVIKIGNWARRLIF